MLQARTGLAGAMIDGKIYVAGGHEGPPVVFLSSCEEYIPEISGIETEFDLYPDRIMLFQNFPNPFNPSTSIQYAVSSRQFIKLTVYNLLGSEIETLVNEEKAAGTYEVTWYAGQLPCGVYYYQLKACDPSTRSGQGFVQTKKMLLLK